MQSPFPLLDAVSANCSDCPSAGQPQPFQPIALTETGSASRQASTPSSVFPKYQPPLEEATPDLDAVRAEAQAILTRAIQEAERIREQAYREGYQSGYEAGYADGANEARQHAEATLQRTLENLHAQVAELCRVLRAEYDAYLQRTEQQMVELAIEVARKVVREELRLQPEHVVAVVRETLRRLQGFGRVRIRVHPLDVELVRRHRPLLLQVVDGIEAIEIVEDRRVGQGGCIIETDQGIYDARIDTQLSELERAIREAA
ncbi:MAG: FliH/SctL family protein [Fimbriimonadales bacterium]|nr:FliH/SctL family protein [Fimbriimonadales bacterium]MDW8052391.1 FliH/SctL family protein [Armatimonadota bacterium]